MSYLYGRVVPTSLSYGSTVTSSYPRSICYDLCWDYIQYTKKYHEYPDTASFPSFPNTAPTTGIISGTDLIRNTLSVWYPTFQRLHLYRFYTLTHFNIHLLLINLIGIPTDQTLFITYLYLL